MGRSGERGVGELRDARGGECDGGDAFLGGFGCDSAVVIVRVVLYWERDPGTYMAEAPGVPTPKRSVKYSIRWIWVNVEGTPLRLLPVLGALIANSGGEQKILGASVCMP